MAREEESHDQRYELDFPDMRTMRHTCLNLLWLQCRFWSSYSPVKAAVVHWKKTLKCKVWPERIKIRAKIRLEFWYCSFFVYTILNFPRFFSTEVARQMCGKFKIVQTKNVQYHISNLIFALEMFTSFITLFYWPILLIILKLYCTIAGRRASLSRGEES